MNIISLILYGYGLGIIITYLILNTLNYEYHALNSNDINKIIINIDDIKYNLVPFKI